MLSMHAKFEKNSCKYLLGVLGKRIFELRIVIGILQRIILYISSRKFMNQANLKTIIPIAF